LAKEKREKNRKNRYERKRGDIGHSGQVVLSGREEHIWNMNTKIK
jgi:hypothetical protein